jgi:methylenetetrahydrofolate dehydrogenase (NADP+)/methenyltetrahydrofolate cyclohydrolase
MIQKPAKTTFQKENGTDFSSWWEALVGAIDPEKDVDCLTSVNLQKIKDEQGGILPATVRAVVSILMEAKRELGISDHVWKEKMVAVIGRSDIVGRPLSWVLSKHHNTVDLFGKSDTPKNLDGYEIVISAVGVPNLITKVRDEAIVIDVGSPEGDVDYDAVASKVSFITPVPGGVGPVTVICLMENVIETFRRKI